jgi:hypothetical protein
LLVDTARLLGKAVSATPSWEDAAVPADVDDPDRTVGGPPADSRVRGRSPRWWRRRNRLAGSAPAELYPSLRFIEAELDRSELSYQQRAQSLDGKAGLVLGAAGVVVALAATHESVLRTVGQGFAVAAGIAAGWAFVPRTGGTINPSTLQEFYLDQPELATRLTLLATRVDLYRADEESLKRKFRRLLVSMGLLLLAAVAVFAGSILDVS